MYRRLPLLLTLATQGFYCQTAIPPASQLHDPPGHAVLFKLQTLPTSVQIYTCREAGPAKSYGWSAPDPDAIATDNSLTVHHYKGPTWEATDGSMIRGSNARHFLAPRANAVDWLELTASGGAGKFATVDLIHRVDTSGGMPPSQPCDAAHNQEQLRVPYSATYLFYSPK